jgi:P27 family predicted phage terminase small subunit
MVAKKPPERRQRGGRTKDVGQVLALTPVDQAAKFPLPDSGWLPEVAEAWHEFFSSPLAGPKVFKSTDLPALRRLFVYRDRLLHATQQFEEQPTTEGSMGQQVLSPWAAEMHRLEAEIQKLEDRFGLTPLARLRLGVTFEEGVGLAARNQQLLEAFHRQA